MGRTRNIGKIEPVPKVWLSKKELASYLGVTERYIETKINTNPNINIYRLSNKCFLYNRENIDTIVKRARI